MRFQAKAAVATLVLALACAPMLAQQGAPDNPPPPPQSMPADMGPGGPGMRGGMRMGMERGRGRGMGMGGDFGLGLGLGRFGAGGFLARAEFALRDPQIRQQLGFSDQQAAKLEQEITDFRKAMIQNRANLEIQRIDLRNLVAADNPDRAAVEKKLQMVGAAQLALQKSVVDFALTLKQEITPEQREKIRQFLRERRQRGMRGDARTEGRYRRAPGPRAGQRPQPEAPPQPNPSEPPQ